MTASSATAQFPAVRAGGDSAADALATLEPRISTMVDHVLWWANALVIARANPA